MTKNSSLQPVKIQHLTISYLGLPTIWHGNVALFSFEDALKFINYCKKNLIFIIGIEGFLFYGKNLVPEMDCIFDASHSKIEKENIDILSDSASKFVKLFAEKGIFFEFILLK